MTIPTHFALSTVNPATVNPAAATPAHPARSRFMASALLALSVASVGGLSHAETAEKLSTLNIGYQKYGLLPIVKARGELEKALKPQGIQVKWIEFPAGPQLLEGLNVGSVVLGETGEAPPIFAQAANANLVYVANQPPAPKAEAILVNQTSSIKTVKDLKGKRVALNKGSNVHYLLLKQLQKNGLSLKDINVVYLPPSDARAAFESGAVDAWVIWDPFFAAAQQQLKARVVADGLGVVNNHQFYLADRSFAQNYPKVLSTVVQTLNRNTEWVKTHRSDAAQLLQQPTGLSLPILTTALGRMGFGVQRIQPQVLNKQQAVADAFYQQQLIPKAINVKLAVLGSKAAATP